MKEGSQFISIRSLPYIDQKALVEAGQKGKFSGVTIEMTQKNAPSTQSSLWEIKNLLMTSDVMSLPSEEGSSVFPIFLYNMRQYAYGNFSDMRHLAMLD